MNLQSVLHNASTEVFPVDPFDRLPALSWGGTVVVGFAIFGAIVGPDRMIDGFKNVLRVEGDISRAVSRS